MISASGFEYYVYFPGVSLGSLRRGLKKKPEKGFVRGPPAYPLPSNARFQRAFEAIAR